ncbi:MAG: NADH-quinone oxidoreductase subunit C [Candidatus Thermoplasmatota archaeon]|nr:NADH-quinone oxidoreductase subunit C [Candidatus Thermoplasmatota archaeon]
MKYKTAQEIADSFAKKFKGDLIEEPYVKTFANGVKKVEFSQLFVRVKRERFIEAAEHLTSFGWPHHTVASGSDLDDEIEILFHFEVYPESHGHGVTVTIGTRAPKSDPHIPSLSDVYPAVTTTEREKQEFLGIAIDGIKDNRRMWLVHAVPVGVYPWRKDEFGPEKLVRNVHDDPSGGGDGTQVIADYSPFPPGGPPVSRKKTEGGDV